MKRKAILIFFIFLVILLLYIIIYTIRKYTTQVDKYHIEKKYSININKDKYLDLLNKNQRIPKIIHQTYFTKEMDIEYYETCMINKNTNPEYEYKFYDDNDVRNYIKENFPQYLDAYNKIIPGAYKADLFRYLILYKEGGVYMDCKSSTIFPLRDFIDQDIGFVSFKDRLEGTIQISFIASVPGHPLIKKCIELTIDNIINERYGINTLDISGPQLCGRAFNILLRRPQLEEIDEQLYKEIDVDIIGSFVTIGKNKYQVLCDRNLKPLVSRACSSYYNQSLNKDNYHVRWNSRTVYN